MTENRFVFGTPSVFSIELSHDPVDDDSRYMSGRLRLVFGHEVLGHIEDAKCALSSPFQQLSYVHDNIDNLRSVEFVNRSPEEVFLLLDRLLFVDDSRSDEKVNEDSAIFSRFSFMTNAGEMFDRTKSFLYSSEGDKIIIVFTTEETGNTVHVASLSKIVFSQTVGTFIDWYQSTERRHVKKTNLNAGGH